MVLCYHSVSADAPYASATPALFERTLAWVNEHCDLIPFGDALQPALGTRPRVAITFDDGYADNQDLLGVLERTHPRSIALHAAVAARLLRAEPSLVQVAPGRSPSR